METVKELCTTPTKKLKSCIEDAYDGPALELKCINTIRALSADQVSTAKSGHPGAPMGCAPMAHLLWCEVMTYSPSKPEWWNRDRFVLSNGHCCAMLYSMLHLSGYNLSMDDLKHFRQIGSKTPGHPENFMTEGVEVSTGPLGQGISNAVGFAIAQSHFSSTYSTKDFPSIFDHYTYVICGDGCLQEGISSEACSLAGHLGLGRLIVLYDDNLITIDGSTDLSFTEDVNKRFESYGWHVQTVGDIESGVKDLRASIEAAKSELGKPSLIKIRTTIGYGSFNEGTAATHGAPLKPDDLSQTKLKYGLDPSKHFQVPDDVSQAYEARTELVESKREAWEATYKKYKIAYPDKATELERRFNRELPDVCLDSLPTFAFGIDKPQATRKYSNICLNAVAPILPELIGGSADLTPSNLTALACSGDFQKDSPSGRYLRFGVREHGMAAICNGLFAYGGIRPFCATFLNFAGYALGSIRVSALSQFGVLYIMTHDSIGLGEDGPTHQPVEMIESLRSMPNINVFRPADLNEMNAAYQVSLTNFKTPTVICCSRSTVPALENTTIEKGMKGAYILIGEEIKAPDLILVSSGSEIGLCLAALIKISEYGIKTRVVSMPCQEIFLAQSQQYQISVLPGDIPTLSVEASAINGWHRFSHAQIGMSTFGVSAPADDVFKKFGFTDSNVAEKAKILVEHYLKSGSVPKLMDRPIFDDNVEDGMH